MLSTEGQILIKLQIRWASFVGSIPCKLDGNSPRVLRTEYNWKKFLIHSAFHWIYNVYLAARLITLRGDSRRDYYLCIAALLMHIFFCLLSMFVILESWNNRIASFNVGYDYWMYFKEKYIKKTRVFSNPADALCGLLTVISFGCGPLIFLCLKLYFPKSPYFIYTILPESLIGLWITFPWDMLLLWMMWNGWSLVALMFHLAFMNVVTAIMVISKELVPNRENYLTENHLRTPKNLRHVYRSLQLMLTSYQELFGHLAFPVQLILNRAFILSTFLLIRYHNRISVGTKLILFFCSVACTLWFLILYMGGRMAVCSKMCLVSWKHFRWPTKSPSQFTEVKSMSKFRKSCYRLRFKMGAFYYIGRGSSLKYFRDITRGTSKALIAIKK